jgi:hypothetical protein
MKAETRYGKPPEWRRWLGIALRTGHIAGVVMMGAGVLGAVPRSLTFGTALVLASGLALLAAELIDGRVHLDELAGAVVVLKLVIVGWMAVDTARAQFLFWALLVLSTVVSHAPRRVRHWKPGRPTS